jgi:hypothetical protein
MVRSAAPSGWVSTVRVRAAVTNALSSEAGGSYGKVKQQFASRLRVFHYREMPHARQQLERVPGTTP